MINTKYVILVVSDNDSFYKKLQTENERSHLKYDIAYIKDCKEALNFAHEHFVDFLFVDQETDEVCVFVDDLKNISTLEKTVIAMYGKEVPDEEKASKLDQGVDSIINSHSSVEYIFSKINSLLRLINKKKNFSISTDRKLTFIDDMYEVEFRNHRFKLTRKEFLILKTLVENPAKVFSQEELNKLTSGEDVFVSKRCIDTFVTLLRKKIGKSSILSVRKKGYKINI